MPVILSEPNQARSAHINLLDLCINITLLCPTYALIVYRNPSHGWSSQEKLVVGQRAIDKHQWMSTHWTLEGQAD